MNPLPRICDEDDSAARCTAKCLIVGLLIAAAYAALCVASNRCW